MPNRRLEAFEQQGVECNRNRTHRHHQAGQFGADDHLHERVEQTGRDWDAQCVVNKSPEQILLDLAHRRLRYLQRHDHIADVVFDQDHIARFLGHVRSGADSHANLGLGQGGRIVHAVAHHGYFLAGGLQLFDFLGLILRQHLGQNLVNAQGEDVVAGIRTPRPIAGMEQGMPEIYRQLVELRDRLEGHYLEIQDFEFTIERGRLYCLQTRNGKMNARALVRTSIEMLKEGLITREQALLRVDPAMLEVRSVARGDCAHRAH